MQQKHYHIDDLKMRLMHDKRLGKKIRADDNDNNSIPPYIRKYNRRFKSIYESMHKNPYDDDMIQHERHFRLDHNNKKKKNGRDYDGKNVYGYFEKYQTSSTNDVYRTNEIPESDVLSEIVQKARLRNERHKKHRYHHHHHSKLKKLRTRPEAGIMQKKIKI